MPTIHISKLESKLYPKLFFLLVPPIICFGPITGVIASGMLYGDISPYGQLIGNRLKMAAVWVRLS